MRALALTLAVLVIPACVHAAGEGGGGSPFRLTGGSVSFLGSMLSRDGSPADYPDRYGRVLVNPSASLWDVPMSLEVLLSSVESENRQRISFFSLSARPSESGRGGLMAHVRRLGIGTSSLFLSPLVMDGRPVTGAEIELTPGPFYADIGGGRMRRSIDPADTTAYAYTRWVWGLRAGVGRPGGSHLHLSYLHGWDNSRISGGGPWLDLPPAESHTASVQARFEAGRATLRGEAAWSLYTADRNAPTKEYEDVPGWVFDLFSPNLTSRIAMSASGEALLRLGATSLRTGLTYVEPGYASLGAPSLRPDLLEYEASATHRLSARRLTLTAFLRRSRDNLVEWKSSRTTTSSAGARATWAPAGRWYVSAGASPWFRRSDGEPGADMDSWLATVSAGGSAPLSRLELSTAGTFGLQRSAWKDSDRSYTGRTWSVTQTASDRTGLSATGSFTLHQSRQPEESWDRRIWAVEGGYTDPARWSASAGVRLARGGAGRRRLSTWVGGSPPSIGGFLELSARLGRTTFQSEVDEGYTELEGRLAGSIIW
jgi:hypothetical protein